MQANVLEPVETLVVTFFEHPVLAARVRDGTIYLAISDMCATAELNYRAQLRRLRADQDLKDGVQQVRLPTPGGFQAQYCQILEYVPTWISTIDRARASDVVKERLRYLRRHIIREVYDSIMRAAGLPEGQSRTIEDLRDLEKFDNAIQGIAERQHALEESQENARQAWKDHEQRLRALEERLARIGPISNAQRGHIYQLVHIWAQALTDRDQIPFSRAISTCWGVLKKRYDLAKYEHLPAAEYDDCIGFIKQSYATLTGANLTGEQLRFIEFDDQ
jgi:hypothetical protein